MYLQFAKARIVAKEATFPFARQQAAMCVFSENTSIIAAGQRRHADA